MLGRLPAFAIVLVALSPLALARPFVVDDEEGIATQGSHETWSNVTNGFPCIQVTQPVRITLTLQSAAPGDAVTLTLPTGEHGPVSSVARLGSPAVVSGIFPTPCDGEFTVDGTSVASATVYSIHFDW